MRLVSTFSAGWGVAECWRDKSRTAPVASQGCALSDLGANLPILFVTGSVSATSPTQAEHVNDHA